MDKKIWEFVQTDPQYKNKTALLITVDHGRGDKKSQNGPAITMKLLAAMKYGLL